MAIQSYADIMARLNNPYGTMTEQPEKRAADAWSEYVLKLLEDTNPQGGMLDRDPFRRQNEIDARIKREQEAKAAQATQTAGVGGGMMTSGSGGGDGIQGRNAIQEREDALRAANLPEEEVQAIMAAEQEARGKAVNDFLTKLSSGGLFGIVSQLIGGGLTNTAAPTRVATGQTPAQIAQQQRDLQAAAVAQQQQAAAEEAAMQRAQAAQARAMESGIPAVTRSGGGSFTVSDGSGGSTTYTGSGGYGGGGSLESTYGGGL